MTTIWQQIQDLRTDMSQYVMHCTKAKRDDSGRVLMPAEEVHRQILRDGFLRATYGEFKSTRTFKVKRTVRGPNPVVCLTEQPLSSFVQTLRATGRDRYTEFAIAVRKDDLFDYGGRPVIYDEDSSQGLHKLSEDFQYRWVGYDPTVLWDRQYPIDWTHEREWRVRPNSNTNHRAGLGDESESVVPIRLSTGRPSASESFRFVILVDTEERRELLRGWIESQLPSIAKSSEYGSKYGEALAVAPLISFEGIADQGVERLEELCPL